MNEYYFGLNLIEVQFLIELLERQRTLSNNNSTLPDEAKSFLVANLDKLLSGLREGRNVLLENESKK